MWYTNILKYAQINPTFISSLNLPMLTIFLVQIGILAAFLILTLISYNCKIFANAWGYSLILLDSFQIVYIETASSCFGNNGWCQSDAKYQISIIAMMITYSLLVIYLRSYLYLPFHDNDNYLSMKSGTLFLVIYLYNLKVSLFNHSSVISNSSTGSQLILILTVFLFGYSQSQNWNHPLALKIWHSMSFFLLWTTFLIYSIPYLQILSIGVNYDPVTIFWYFWGYSMPLIIFVSFLTVQQVDSQKSWVKLFLEDFNKIRDLQSLFMMSNRLIQNIALIKKSQLKLHNPAFKDLCELIHKHNQDCTDSDCPLAVIKDIKINKNDDFLEQKRLTKTIQSCLEFGLYVLESQKNYYPNLISLNVEIANYELQIFHQRQKGLLLFTKYYKNSSTSSQQNFSLYFLKKKIDYFYSHHEDFNKINTNNEQDIASFKHNIEVSVTMLAEFWYFLSDPKCNLKKLYDLANVLFPLKIGVDNEWTNIKCFNNIQSYHLYSRQEFIYPRYLIKMFNDKEKGLQILEEAKKIEKEAKEQDQIEVGAEGTNNAFADQFGMIFLEFDGKNSGVMYQVNSACQKIFGYNKGELLNRKVNDIMPTLISNYHDRILQNYQQTNKSRMMNKDRHVWGRSKDGYLFPFTICIKPIRSFFSQSSQVYASIKREIWMKEYAFMFVDNQYNITDVSSSLLGLFPDLFGRVNLKKKISGMEVLPNLISAKDNYINLKESCQLMVKRQFKLSATQSYTEQTLFSLTFQEISVMVAGKIGYYIKFNKGSNMQASNIIENLANSHVSKSPSKISEMNNSQSFHRGSNNFMFFANVEQKDKEQSMNYYGGVSENMKNTKESIFNQMKQNFKLTVHEKNEAETVKKDYGAEIHMKRLQNNIIREIHDMSEQQSFNNNIGQSSNEEQEASELIKPSELNSILAKEISNKHINLLKIITLLIIFGSSALCIFEYVMLHNINASIVSAMTTFKYFEEMEAEILYVNIIDNKFAIWPSSEADVASYLAEVGQLNSYSQKFESTSTTTVIYSDYTNETMLLTFAINKLISEANYFTSSGSSQPSNTDRHIFYVDYNSINSILTTMGNDQTLQINNLTQIINQIVSISQNYLIIAVSIFIVILILKNVILRMVLTKKAEILNIFFEIPRASCNSIQKECEKFIQILNADQGEDRDIVSDEEEKQILQNKDKGKQKKRTIMGEEKTAKNFIFATIFFLLILLVFHTFSFTTSMLKQSQSQFVMNRVTSLFKLEKQFSKSISYINSWIINPTFPIANDPNPILKIQTQQQNIVRQFQASELNLYYIENILDSEYESSYKALFYSNLCNNSLICFNSYGQDKGLNAILFNYFDYLMQKHIHFYQNYTSDHKFASNQTSILTPSIFDNQENFRLLFKKYWRDQTAILNSATQRYFTVNQTAMFALMLTMVIFNFTFLLYGWIHFYNSLQQKIIATQYILTFIPIDQINKNSKIVKYIKEEILEKK